MTEEQKKQKAAEDGSSLIMGGIEAAMESFEAEHGRVPESLFEFLEYYYSHTDA